MDILSDDYIAQANTELATKPCLSCRTIGTASVSKQFLPSPAFSLAGAQAKVSGSFALVLECSHCGLRGRVSEA